MIEIAPAIPRNINQSIGITLPFITSTGELFPISYTTEQQVISNLKNLLLTRKGERIMQPLFGTRLWEIIFEPNTELLKTKVEDYIYSALEIWMPYIIVNDLQVQTVSVNSNTELEDHGITIQLNVSVSELGANIPITFLFTANTAEVL